MKASIVLSLGVLSIALGACEMATFGNRSDIKVTNAALAVPPPVDPSFAPVVPADAPVDGVLIGPSSRTATDSYDTVLKTNSNINMKANSQSDSFDTVMTHKGTMSASISDDGIVMGTPNLPPPLPAPDVEMMPLSPAEMLAHRDLEQYQTPRASVPMVLPSPPAMNAGVSMGDPSVTIYPLDGEPLIAVSPNIGGSAMPALDTGRAYNNNMAPRYSSASGNVSARDAVIYFDHGSSRLGSGDMQKLSQVAETAKFSPVDRVKVEGHASSRAQTNDPIRNSILNLKESMNRAFVVSKTLIEKGVPAEKLKTTAFGDTVPAPSEEEQRRVDIVTGAGY
ncbi:MAG: OmpA family protein [Alphaproteobacteria bacterium]|nr:OmpA family protein [Alphaproteobacteria bacterium]NCQ88137.1 OmpA family protein [Alphaproteobacteria bacterium]NCT05356.1 OmpA family protein [Alphaproteobacteria bacterium]